MFVEGSIFIGVSEINTRLGGWSNCERKSNRSSKCA